MPEASNSPKEKKRIEAVKKSRMLGTPAEERFDRITRLARLVFNVPMAVIDIVGEKISWIKSAQGMTEVFGLRKDSYCHHTVLNDEVCLVFDAREDPRFFDSEFANTWVFYAGAPIHFEGELIGVLCVGDNKPREFSSDYRQALQDLAGLVEQEINLCALSEAQIILAEKNDELARQCRIDHLTRSWNKSAIFDIAKTELARRNNNSFFAIMMIDVDNFKMINDTYSHPAGDLVISIVAEKIRSALRPMDAVGRYGGDEFTVVLSNIDNNEDLIGIGQKICDEIESTLINFEGRVISVTCSVGCALTKDICNIDWLIKQADKALYEAKSTGRVSSMSLNKR